MKTMAWLGKTETDAAENAAIARYKRRHEPNLWHLIYLAIRVLVGRPTNPIHPA